MAQTAHDLDLAGAADSGLSLRSIDPQINWRKFPQVVLPRSAYQPAYLPVISYVGGAFGDDQTLSTASSTDAYSPKTQGEKATLMGTTIVQDVGVPRGWIEPREAYGPPPVSPTDDPTITSLSPNTAATGGAPIWVTITGTKFTQWSWVETGGVYTPYSRYISPTKMAVLQDPRSTAGTVVVKVVDHDVKSNGSNFTFT